LKDAREETSCRIRHIHSVVMLELAITQAKRLDSLLLNESAVYATLAISPPNKITQRVPNP
jgi:hypothetical protein